MRPSASSPTPRCGEGSGLTARKAIELFEDQVTSRALDVAARELKKTNRSFYTISSRRPREQRRRSGATLRITDPGLPALPLRGADDGARPPAAGHARRPSTRCSARGQQRRPDRAGPPQGLGQPPAVGPAADLHHRQPPAEGDGPRLQPGARAAPGRRRASCPADAIVLCSFGDASANHATALAAINTARYAARVGLPMPILFVCEDNGIGISVPTPDGWIARHVRPRSRTCATCWPTASSTRSGTPSPRRSRYVRSARQPGLPAPADWCACGATPAATSSTRYRSRRRDRGDRGRATRCCATRGG